MRGVGGGGRRFIREVIQVLKTGRLTCGWAKTGSLYAEKYGIFSNDYVDSFKMFFVASSQTCSAIVTTKWRPGLKSVPCSLITLLE